MAPGRARDARRGRDEEESDSGMGSERGGRGQQEAVAGIGCRFISNGRPPLVTRISAMETDLINFSIDLLIESHQVVQDDSVDLLKSIERENSTIQSLQSEVSQKTAEILAVNDELACDQKEKTAELDVIRHLYAEVQSKLQSVLEENKLLRESLTIVQEEKDEIVKLEDQLKSLETEKKSVSSKMEFALRQAKKWEKTVTDLNGEKDGLEQELREIREQNDKQNKEIVDYLEQYRDVKNLLKQEKNKVDSMAGQWRYYRNNHKQNEKLKKQLAEQIDEFLSCDDLPVDCIRDFVGMIKRRLRGDDSDDEAEEEVENVPHHKVSQSNGIPRQPLSDNHN